MIVSYLLSTSKSKFSLVFLLSKEIHNGSTNFSNNKNLNSQVKVFGKLLGNKSAGSKKRWYPSESQGMSPILPSATRFGQTNHREGGKNSRRRVNVLNKLFMTQVTDLLASGKISEKILGKSLEISRVKVASDFKTINVYWMAKGDENDEILETILHHNSGLLRHELSQLKMMGEVPRIHFIKDKLYANMTEVEVLLQKCDFGEDYMTTNELNSANNVRNELNLETYDETEIQQSDNDSVESSVKLESLFPKMRHDVMGLNHKDIMGKIFTKLRKSKEAWDTFKELENKALHDTQKENILNENNEKIKVFNEKDDTEFQKFLVKRSAVNKKNTPDRKKHLNLLDEGFRNELPNFEKEFNDKSDADYLDDWENDLKPK